VTVRLVADAVFTVDAEDTVWRPGAVEIDGGRITWVGDPDLTPAEARTDVQELGGLLMPGLVNCHGHSPMTLVRSAGDGLPLDRWLSEAVWPREALHGDEDVFWGMTLGASEMLLNGITTTCEQYLHADAVADAALASGIRCVLTPGVFDMPGIDPEGTWKEHLVEASRVFDEMDGRSGRLHVGFGPHAAYSLSPAGLSAVAEEAQRRGAMIQIHLAETEAEGHVVEERYGMRAPAFLASLGVLDGPVLAAHAVWLDEADMEIMAEYDVAWRTAPGATGSWARAWPSWPSCEPGGSGSAWGPTGPPPTTTSICGTRCAWRRFWLGPPRRIRRPSARRPPSDWPPEAGARPWAFPSGPSKRAVRRTSSACVPTTPDSCRPPTRPSCSGTSCGLGRAIS
jgi:5-methylthioadenosine/S-adenosylhomocysteine deaminase